MSYNGPNKPPKSDVGWFALSLLLAGLFGWAIAELISWAVEL